MHRPSNSTFEPDLKAHLMKNSNTFLHSDYRNVMNFWPAIQYFKKITLTDRKDISSVWLYWYRKAFHSARDGTHSSGDSALYAWKSLCRTRNRRCHNDSRRRGPHIPDKVPWTETVSRTAAKEIDWSFDHQSVRRGCDLLKEKTMITGHLGFKKTCQRTSCVSRSFS